MSKPCSVRRSCKRNNFSRRLLHLPLPIATKNQSWSWYQSPHSITLHCIAWQVLPRQEILGSEVEEAVGRGQSWHLSLVGGAVAEGALVQGQGCSRVRFAKIDMSECLWYTASLRSSWSSGVHSPQCNGPQQGRCRPSPWWSNCIITISEMKSQPQSLETPVYSLLMSIYI